jgi:outer membrane receptor protein involved in Fe transport
MTIVTEKDILLSGHTDVVDVLNELPQTIINSTADYGNNSNPGQSAGGFATADLRGLGPQRTIVLVNGRRLGVGDPNTANPDSAPDLDQIPAAMIERVEIVTGGASATYGSDAVAGAVNFILKDHVQGVQLDGQYGFAQHHQNNQYIQNLEADAGITPPTGTALDGSRGDLSILAGTDFLAGTGQVTTYFSYHTQSALRGSDRDFSACQAADANFLTGTPSKVGLRCFGSSTSNRFDTDGGANSYSVAGSEFVPWPASGTTPPAHFNAAPYQYAQRHDTRYQAGLLGHLELSPALRPYIEISFMDDRTLMEIAPSGIFLGQNPHTPDGQYLVNCSNPLLSAQQASLLCTPAQIAADQASPGSVSADVDIGRRNIEGGARGSSFEHKNYRAVAGLGGRLTDAFTYDAYALYYYTSLDQSNLNYLNYAAINNALQVSPDGSGHPACISGGSCVPYNIFTTGAVTPRQLSYLYTPGTDGGSNSEQIVAANLTGQLDRYGIATPWAHVGVAFNAGLEHRVETLRFAPDAAELSGELAGYSGAAVAIDRRLSVDEGFAEIRAPLAQDLRLVKELTLGAGYRYSHYSTAGVANAYKFELQYAPIADVRLRASYDRVVRAPNLTEIYTPLSYTASSTVNNDPCAPTMGGATHATASLAACEHTGITAAQYGDGFGPAVGGTSTIAQCPFGCGSAVGGNVQLAPETADTWSVGFTLTPAALAGFTATVDYFHILLKREIGTVPGSISLQQCLATGDPTSCGQVVRTPLGALSGANVAGGGYVLENDVNTGTALVSGIDLQLNVRWPLPGAWGALTASLVGTWLQHDSSTPFQGAPSYDCAGLFGNTCLGGSVGPKWRHNLRVSWETPWNLQLSAQWRFIGPTSFDNNSSQPALQYAEEGFFDTMVTHIPGYSYVDLSAIWAASSRVQVRAGIGNLLDKDPPLVASFDISGAAGTLNTFPAYDLLGRRMFLAVRTTF